MPPDRSVLIVGPTPPPFGGQTLMIQALLDSKSAIFSDYEWSVAPVHFSPELKNTGEFAVRKVLHLGGLICRVLFLRWTKRPKILYYTPAGPTRLAVFRDIILLCIVRPFFTMTILHFHAGGVSEVYEQLPVFSRPFYRRAYWNADLGIMVSKHAPDDPTKLHARATLVIPNGVQDLAAGRRSVGQHGVARQIGR